MANRLLTYSTDLCFMRYHDVSVLIIDPFGSILHIVAACCFEDSSGMQVSDGITKSWPVATHAWARSVRACGSEVSPPCWNLKKDGNQSHQCDERNRLGSRCL